MRRKNLFDQFRRARSTLGGLANGSRERAPDDKFRASTLSPPIIILAMGYGFAESALRLRDKHVEMPMKKHDNLPL
jgi:hypothetical protein